MTIIDALHWVFYVGCILIVISAYCFTQSKTFIDPIQLLAGLLFLAFVIKPLYFLVSEGAIYSILIGEVPYYIFSRAMFWVTVGTAGIFLGILLYDVLLVTLGRKAPIHLFTSRSVISRSTIIITISLSLFLTVFLTLQGYSSLGWVGYRPQLIGVWGGLENIAKLSIPAFNVYIYFKRRWDFYSIFGLIVGIVSCLAASNRADLFIFILGVIFSTHFLIRPYKLTFFATLTFASILWVWISHTLKGVLKRGIVYLETQKYDGPIDSLFNGSALFPFDFLQTLAIVHKYNLLTFQPLEMYQFLLTFWIPRAIWPDKPISIGTAFAGGIDEITARSWSISIFGDSIISGGVLLLLLNMIILGFIIQLFRRKFYSRLQRFSIAKVSPFNYFGTLFLFSHSILIFKNGIVSAITSLVSYAIFTFFLYKAAIRIKA